MSTVAREGQTLRGRGRWVAYANLVKLPHTVFALPFALVGVVVASYHVPVRPRVVALAIVAFTAARFAAMAFNRLVDRAYDAANPRTAGRELPQGRLTPRQAAAATAVAAALFLASAAALNPLCAVLAPVALAWILFYSYTKRFTRWSHAVLGLSLAIAPVGGYLAVAGRWSEPPATLLLLAGAVLTWVAGFDILYALQDVDFDRRIGLHSLPAALGPAAALRIARALHALTVLLLLALWAVAPELDGGALVGTGIVAALLVYEHRLVRPDDLSRLDEAFFRVNGILAIVYFAAVWVERLLRA